jgi:hypothetical protein
MDMVPPRARSRALSCASWLRLLLTTLLCVAGVARPIGHRTDANAVRAAEPMHVSAPGRTIELSRVGTRFVDDPVGDGPATFASPVEHIGSRDPELVDARPDEGVLLSSAPHDLSRARGPPIA